MCKLTWPVKDINVVLEGAGIADADDVSLSKPERGYGAELLVEPDQKLVKTSGTGDVI